MGIYATNNPKTKLEEILQVKCGQYICMIDVGEPGRFRHDILAIVKRKMTSLTSLRTKGVQVLQGTRKVT